MIFYWKKKTCGIQSFMKQEILWNVLWEEVGKVDEIWWVVTKFGRKKLSSKV